MDRLSQIQRSENMRRIRDSNTSPELIVRKMVRSLGFSGYRIHRRDITGNPDIAWIRKKCVIFVHGCFWHGHNCAEGSRIPKSNVEYWKGKIRRNQERDEAVMIKLISSEWRVLVVWECECKSEENLNEKLAAFLCKFMN